MAGLKKWSDTDEHYTHTHTHPWDTCWNSDDENYMHSHNVATPAQFRSWSISMPGIKLLQSAWNLDGFPIEWRIYNKYIIPIDNGALNVCLFLSLFRSLSMSQLFAFIKFYSFRCGYILAQSSVRLSFAVLSPCSFLVSFGVFPSITSSNCMFGRTEMHYRSLSFAAHSRIMSIWCVIAHVRFSLKAFLQSISNAYPMYGSIIPIPVVCIFICNNPHCSGC